MEKPSEDHENHCHAMDADYGLANLDVTLGLPPGPTLHDLVRGTHDLKEVLRSHPTGVRVLDGCSVVAEMADLDPTALDAILKSLQRLEATTDYLLVDVAAGVHEAAIATFGAADETIIVMHEDPSSFVNAYATLKCLAASNPSANIRVVVNEVPDMSTGKLLFARLQAVARERLDASITFVGALRRDEAMASAIRARATVFERSPDAPVSRDLVDLATALAPGGLRMERVRTSFFTRLLGLDRLGRRAA